MARREWKKITLKELWALTEGLSGYELFERVFVILAFHRAIHDKKLKVKDFAEKALASPKRKTPSRTLYALLGTTATKQPQNLSLKEAYQMAWAIDEDFAEFCWHVRQTIKRSETVEPL